MNLKEFQILAGGSNANITELWYITKEEFEIFHF
jgi:hypothetical protein